MNYIWNPLKTEDGKGNYRNSKMVQLFTTFKLGLRHLREHTFKHSFLNSICSSGENIGTSYHYLLHCTIYSNERLTFPNVIEEIKKSVLEESDFKAHLTNTHTVKAT